MEVEDVEALDDRALLDMVQAKDEAESEVDGTRQAVEMALERTCTELWPLWGFNPPEAGGEVEGKRNPARIERRAGDLGWNVVARSGAVLHRLPGPREDTAHRSLAETAARQLVAHRIGRQAARWAQAYAAGGARRAQAMEAARRSRLQRKEGRWAKGLAAARRLTALLRRRQAPQGEGGGRWTARHS